MKIGIGLELVCLQVYLSSPVIEYIYLYLHEFGRVPGLGRNE